MDSPQEKILVIKLGALGDFIQALGPMRAIRTHHPKAHITIMTTTPFAAMAKDSGYGDAVYIDSRPKFSQITKWGALFNFFWTSKFSRIYDLQNNDRTSLYFKLCYPKPEWVGVARGASHRNSSPERTQGLAFYGHVQTLELAGIQDVAIDKLEWMQGDISAFPLRPPYALLIPGSALNRPEKRWPAAQYAALASALAEKDIQPVLLGSEAEKDITDEIAGFCPQAINLCGKTSLYDIAALARSALCAIGNDTGPMHVIGPTGCQTIVLFTDHSSPQHHAPLGDSVQAIFQKEITPEKIMNAINYSSGDN